MYCRYINNLNSIQQLLFMQATLTFRRDINYEVITSSQFVHLSEESDSTYSVAARPVHEDLF